MRFDKDYKDYKGLDLLKIICAFLIVPLHINPIPKESVLYTLTKTLGNLGVPCFFIMAGFFFFSKLKNMPNAEHKKVLVKYEKRLSIILLCWLLPYFVICDIPWIFTGDNLGTHLCEYIRHIMFGGPGFFLWYMVSLMVAVFLCYILRRLPIKYSVLICMGLYIIGTLVSGWYRKLWDNTAVSYYIDLYNQNFTTTRNGLFFGLPCVYIGMLLAKYKTSLNKSILIGLSLITIILFYYELTWCYKNSLIPAVMSPVTIMVSLLLIVLLMGYEFKNIPSIVSIYMRKSSLLIYLIHPLLIAIIPTVTYLEVDYYWYVYSQFQIPVIIAISTLISFVMIRLSYKYDILKRIM